MALVYCATTPEPTGEPLEPPAAAADDQAAAVAAEAGRQARVAIADAQVAGAETHDPNGLREALDALREGERLRSSDPQAAAEAFGRARDEANRAHRNSRGTEQRALAEEMKDLLQELRDNQADRSRREEYSAAAAEVERVDDLFAADSLAVGIDAAQAVIRRMQTLLDSVAAQVDRVMELKAATEALQDQLDAAAQADAAKVAEMNELYAQGREAFESYALGDAERHFGAAREAGRAALAADTGSDATREQVETLLRTVMNDLEGASLLTVITDDETVVEPAPWQGARFLSEEGAAAADSAAAQPPAEDATVDQVPQHELLQRAKELWLQGVARRNAGDQRGALASFEQAQRYHEAYVALAVMTTYTVRLIPERRESLWRIAEYDFIYGNPRLWPRIWHRNRKLIQDPDLIFPGWNLYIPPAQVSGEAPPAAQ